MSGDVRQRLNPPRDYLREKFLQVEARENKSVQECVRERATRGRTEEEREKDRARGKRRYVTLTLSGLT